jgi:hypothetical protein
MNEAGMLGDMLRNFRLMTELAPVLKHLQALGKAGTPHEQALAVIELAKFGATRTETELDDEALDRIEAVLRTDAGKELLNWVLKQIGVVA